MAKTVGASTLCLVALVALCACERKPAQIKIKLPKDAVQSVKMDPIVPDFTEKNGTVKLRASSFDKEGTYMGQAKVRWSSSDASIATISQDGLVTILSSGKATIKAEMTEGEPKLSATLDIKAVIPNEVKIIPPEDKPGEIHLGETKMFKAQVLDDKGNVIEDAKVLWRTNGFAATVAPNGEVEGRAIGETQLVAESGLLTARHDLNVLDWKKK